MGILREEFTEQSWSFRSTCCNNLIIKERNLIYVCGTHFNSDESHTYGYICPCGKYINLTKHIPRSVKDRVKKDPRKQFYLAKCDHMLNFSHRYMKIRRVVKWCIFHENKYEAYIWCRTCNQTYKIKKSIRK